MKRTPMFFRGDWALLISNAAKYLDLKENEVEITFRSYYDNGKITYMNQTHFDDAAKNNPVLYLFVEPKTF